MIAKISSGKNAVGLAQYLHGEGKRNEHEYTNEQGERVKGGEVIASNMPEYEHNKNGNWAYDINEASKQNERVKSNQIYHTSLSASPNDRKMTNGEWSEIAEEYTDKMGYSDKPWVAVRHSDSHIHIVASKTGFDGQTWHGQKDYKNANRICKQIEKEYQLEQVNHSKSQQAKQLREIKENLGEDKVKELEKTQDQQRDRDQEQAQEQEIHR
jgi:hypothetical protein